jgi:hypothetical protein
MKTQLSNNLCASHPHAQHEQIVKGQSSAISEHHELFAHPGIKTGKYLHAEKLGQDKPSEYTPCLV